MLSIWFVMHTEIVYHRLACLVQTNKLYLSAYTAKFDNDFTIAAIAVTSQKCARDTSITTLETDSLGRVEHSQIGTADR